MRDVRPLVSTIAVTNLLKSIVFIDQTYEFHKAGSIIYLTFFNLPRPATATAATATTTATA